MPDPTRDHVPQSVSLGNPDGPFTISDGRGDSAASTTCADGVVGPPGYELFDEIGRGGMGVVYRGRSRAERLVGKAKQFRRVATGARR